MTNDLGSGVVQQADPPVTVMVARKALPGFETEFEAAVARTIAAACAFPGHLGATVFRPDEPGGEYRVVFKFDHRSNLERWERSEERTRWYNQLDFLADGGPQQQTLTGLEAWFTVPGAKAALPPPRWKMTLLTWAVVYPLITGLFYLIAPVTGTWRLPLRTLLTTALMVPMMTYLIMPGVSRLFKRWLYARA